MSATTSVFWEWGGDPGEQTGFYTIKEEGGHRRNQWLPEGEENERP